jgi:hypothetical protein
MRPPEEKKPWITASELARWADVNPMTARTWIQTYKLGRKFGGRWRADEAITREFLAGQVPAPSLRIGAVGRETAATRMLATTSNEPRHLFRNHWAGRRITRGPLLAVRAWLARLGDDCLNT